MANHNTFLRARASVAVFLRFDVGSDIVSGLFDYARRHRVGISVFCASGAVSGFSLRNASLAHGDRFRLLTLNCETRPEAAAANPLVVLADSCGKVIGGFVVGPILAAEPVLLTVGTFAILDSDDEEGQSSSAVLEGHSRTTAFSQDTFYSARASVAVGLRFDVGSDIISGLFDYARRHRVGISVICAYGAVSGFSLSNGSLAHGDRFRLITLNCEIRPEAAAADPLVVLDDSCGKLIGGPVVGPILAAEPVFVSVGTVAMDSDDSDDDELGAVE